MANVLDLQGLPEGTQALAERMLAAGSCISVISIAAAQARGETATYGGLQASSSAGRGGRAEAAPAAETGWCVSVISYVSAEA
jgi:hypothetical protein